MSSAPDAPLGFPDATAWQLTPREPVLFRWIVFGRPPKLF